MKPWERAGGTSGPAPFKPPSPGSTSDVVEASGTARPGEIVSKPTTSIVNGNTVGRPMPARPWEQNRSSYGGLNSGYGGMYRGGVYGGGGMYNRGMYGGGVRGPMSGYGMGGMRGPYGAQDPQNPHGQPSAPPGFWMSFLRVMEGVVNFFGRISFLIDHNTQAAHMFLSALLQLFDGSGMLYGELARFVMRLVGVRTKPGKVQQPHGPPGPENTHVNQVSNEQLKATPTGGWDSVWGNAGS
ncbi:unnamed protein product [Rhodiola kirilowii]